MRASLSERAQEILRRADAQIAAVNAPPPPPRELPEAPDGFTEGDVAEVARPSDEPDESPRPSGEAAEVHDLGQLLDTVQAGIDAARAHLVTLSASLERIAQELDAAGPAPLVLPPQLAEHAKLPSQLGVPDPDHLSAAAAEVEAAAQDEAAAEPPAEVPVEPAPREPPAVSAAHEAARLVAIEMAVAGDTREGVGRRLRQEFGIRDPGTILDDAFGPAPPGGGGRRTYGV